jgi:hypothetical protein
MNNERRPGEGTAFTGDKVRNHRTTRADAAEQAALARFEIRRWLDRHGGHLMRSLITAQQANAWPRVTVLAWRLQGVGLVGELADAEQTHDAARVRSLELAVRGRRPAGDA